jgi:hypothetical protein
MRLFLVGGIVFALFLTAALVEPVAAQSTAGAASLFITPGARADGMGRAFVALPTDGTANWWNPAALGLQQGRVFSLMHAKLVPDLADDVFYEHLAYAMHLPGWGGVGASLIYLGYGKSMATDEGGQELGEFTSYEISPQLSIGTELLPGIAAGLTLKYVYVNLAPSWATRENLAGTGDTFGADLAVLLRTKELVPSFPVPVNVGVNVQNLGPNIAYIDQDQSDPIPRNLKAGVGVQFLPNGLVALPGWVGLVSYDFNKSLVYSSEKPVHNAGAELSFNNFAAARVGYIYDKAGDIRDPTFGVGFEIPLESVIGSKASIAVDYASVPQARVLNRVNKFSLSFKF